MATIEPHYCGGELEVATRKARNVLCGLGDADVERIAVYTRNLLGSACYYLNIHTKADALHVKVSRNKSNNPERTAELLDQFREIDLVEFACVALNRAPPGGADGRRPENLGQLLPEHLYAVHALVQCARVVRAFKAYKEDLITEGLYHAMIAAEAATIADRPTNRLVEDLQSVLSSRAKMASEARWARLEPVKARAIEMYSSGRNWKSRAEAARRMLPEILRLARENKTPLKPSNAERTIREWLAAAAKSD